MTAIGTAICRLIEEYQPEEIRVCHDTLAKAMILPFYRFIYRFPFIRDFTIKKMEEVAVGIYGAQVCRTRCIDDSVERYLPNGFSQVIILGAGWIREHTACRAWKRSRYSKWICRRFKSRKKSVSGKSSGECPET
jgi:hypothetical protein